MARVQFTIVKSGMGEFLNPPGHPEHRQSVREIVPRGEGGHYSLRAALKAAWVPEETKARVRSILDKWEKSKPATPPREWVLQILGYFKNCYRGSGDAETCWHASNLAIDKDGDLFKRDPFLHQDDHAGIHFIRTYWPEFKAEREDFEAARWGS